MAKDTDDSVDTTESHYPEFIESLNKFKEESHEAIELLTQASRLMDDVRLTRNKLDNQVTRLNTNHFVELHKVNEVVQGRDAEILRAERARILELLKNLKNMADLNDNIDGVRIAIRELIILMGGDDR